jgi:hypothetical protein
VFDDEINSAGKADRLVELCGRLSLGGILRGAAQDWLDDQCPAGARALAAPGSRRSSGLLQRQ